MKIIGKTSDGYLCQVTEDEIFKIFGVHKYDKGAEHTFKSKVTADQGGSYRDLSNMVGLNVPVSDIFDSARMIAQGIDKQYSFTTFLQCANRLQKEIETMAAVFNIHKPKNLEEPA